MALHSRNWDVIGLIAALLGPGMVALLSNAIATDPETIGPRLLGLALFAGLFLFVLWIALRREALNAQQLGFGDPNFWSPVLALLLSVFFIFAFGPIAYMVVDWLQLGSFDETINRLAALPKWYLLLSVVLVAGIEEWFYRGYAIERLAAITGSYWLAGGISLTVFAIVHLPLWGVGPALTTVVSGGILTVLYVLRRDVLMLILAHIATDLYGIVLN